jgi:phosphate transport system ATP-binding protein
VFADRILNQFTKQLGEFSMLNQQNNRPDQKMRDRSQQNQQDNQGEAIFDVQDIKVFYGDFMALDAVKLKIPKNQITAFIGPSGCGKSTLLRCFNRMNDLIAGARVEGTLNYKGKDIYDDKINPVKVRQQIGMVFQKPNPFPKSVYENIAFGPRANGYKGNLDELVEQSLQQAALWDEVKDNLKTSGNDLSGGQQQRLCIARAIAMKPDVILMDEPCSSLDPISTASIEDLCHDLKEQYTIVTVTHNMQQARRLADMTAFFDTETGDGGKRCGKLLEFSPTKELFDSPKSDKTKQYVSGQYG